MKPKQRGSGSGGNEAHKKDIMLKDDAKKDKEDQEPSMPFSSSSSSSSSFPLLFLFSSSSHSPLHFPPPFPPLFPCSFFSFSFPFSTSPLRRFHALIHHLSLFLSYFNFFSFFVYLTFTLLSKGDHLFSLPFSSLPVSLPLPSTPLLLCSLFVISLMIFDPVNVSLFSSVHYFPFAISFLFLDCWKSASLSLLLVSICSFHCRLDDFFFVCVWDCHSIFNIRFCFLWISLSLVREISPLLSPLLSSPSLSSFSLLLDLDQSGLPLPFQLLFSPSLASFSLLLFLFCSLGGVGDVLSFSYQCRSYLLVGSSLFLASLLNFYSYPNDVICALISSSSIGPRTKSPRSPGKKFAISSKPKDGSKSPKDGNKSPGHKVHRASLLLFCLSCWWHLYTIMSSLDPLCFLELIAIVFVVLAHWQLLDSFPPFSLVAFERS